jgi:transposase
LAESLTEELNEYCWLEIFSDEKDINLVLDNVNIYKAILTKKITEILNITIIYLPKYASDLNPIERLWYSIKHILYNRFY